MTRDVDRLSGRTFDLLVAGGGIYGLTVAYDAAQRGLSVALVERDDFGSGSSFNHLRTIHGGLRYLQSLDLRRARESICERRTMARIAPHTVQPLPFVLPLGRSLMKGKAALRAAFCLDAMLAADRNANVPASHALPSGRVIGRSEALARFPELADPQLAGAAIWSDYLTTEADRLTFGFALAAAGHGALLVNYAEAVAPLTDGRRVAGLRVLDRVANREFEVGARLTVNATGACVDRLLAPLGLRSRVPLMKTMNLVTRRPAGSNALGSRAVSGRHLFLVPWRGRAVFGTWESENTRGPEALAPSRHEVESFVADLNQGFPALALTPDEVTLVHRGIVPASVGAGGRLALEGHEQVRDYSTDGVEGLLSVAGTKYTTARAVADRITSLVIEKLGRSPVACRTADVPLPGGDPAASVTASPDGDGFEMSADVVSHLAAAYGSRAPQVLALARQTGLSTKLGDDSPVIGAQLAWAAREEMVVTLADAVVRRTPLGALGYPGDRAADRAAAIVGGELGWSPERRREEVARLRQFYAITEA